MGQKRLTKFALVSFPQKSSFNTIVQLGHNSGQNYTTLCPRQLCLMINSLKILKYGMMRYNSYTKVTINLPKKFPFWARAIWAKFVPKLCNVMYHDSLSEDLFEVLWHDEALDKSSLTHFSKRISFLGNISPFGSKLHNQLL